MNKKIWKYIEIFFIVISLIILVISSLFKFDNNAVMGLDKLIADIIITIICYVLIIKLGIIVSTLASLSVPLVLVVELTVLIAESIFSFTS